jgi:quinol-cytochrome oxidoreductase complex cytochrome b subunit
MLTTALLGLHLLLVQLHGMSVPPAIEQSAHRQGRRLRSMPFVPHFLLRELFGWTVALALLAGLSAFYPWELGHKADPFGPAPAGIRPEWYFLWAFQLFKYMPASVLGVEGERLAVLALSAGAVAIMLLPFVSGRTERGQRLVRWVGGVALLLMAVMTGLAYLEGGAEP